MTSTSKATTINLNPATANQVDPNCVKVITAANKVIAKLNEQLDLDEQLFKSHEEYEKKLKEQVADKDNKINAVYRQPPLLVGATAVGMVLGGPVVGLILFSLSTIL